jgi:Purple acid Phosphatase, N-terminal domain/Calcineurin-like phosphoesterase
MTRELARKLSIAEQHDWFTKQRSRRSLLKGSLATTGAVLAGPKLLQGSDSSALSSARGLAPFTQVRSTRSPVTGASVVPFGRHISYGAQPGTQMNIAWQVASPVSSPFVRIGTKPFDLGEAIGADLKTVTTPWADITDFIDSVPPAQAAAMAPEEQYYAHAAATGLRPGTTYYYTVGHDGFDFGGRPLGGPANVVNGSFTTAPNGQVPFRFTAFGDQGATYDAIGTTNLILSQNPAFHLHAGDISYAENGGDGLITDPYDPRVWDSFFVQVAQTASQIPWMASLGNHEMEPWYSPNGYGADVDRLDFPGNGPSVCPGTYCFTYGNAAFISLDPNDVSYEIPANFGYSGGAQTAWLGSTLAALRSDPAIDFIVVFFHHCAYCTCVVHGCEGGVQQYWTPLFDQYEVDLVINGHNHVYERTDPIVGGNATTTAPIGSVVTPATQGTTYLTAGGAGKSLYSFSAPDSYEGNVDNVVSVSTYVNEAGATTVDETVTWSEVRYTGYCLVVGEVTPPGWGGGTTTLLIRALNEYGVEIDRITISRSSASGGWRAGRN